VGCPVGSWAFEEWLRQERQAGLWTALSINIVSYFSMLDIADSRRARWLPLSRVQGRGRCQPELSAAAMVVVTGS
jgi:hypothetical protein